MVRRRLSGKPVRKDSGFSAVAAFVSHLGLHLIEPLEERRGVFHSASLALSHGAIAKRREPGILANVRDLYGEQLNRCGYFDTWSDPAFGFHSAAWRWASVIC